MKTVFCLMGPTCSGKTNLAIELCQLLPLDIISVDSAMVYKGLDIGTAKPTAVELKHAPHHLIDIRDPAEAYSAADFVSDATCEIEKSCSQNRVPFLVGGTMLYFKALQEGLSDIPSSDIKIREAIAKEASEKTWPVMHERLQKVDPVSAERIRPNDAQRIARALEVYEQTGETLSYWQAKPLKKSAFHFMNVGLIPENREALRVRIAERFDQMLEQGFLDEVKKFSALDANLPSMRAVGYRQVRAYLNGEMDFDTMREKAITATRQLAKRQLTWLRSWENLKAIIAETANVNDVLKLMKE